MRLALTREISSAVERCELTHLARTPIDVALARRQHEEYELALASLGYLVHRLPSADDQPDSVFIEDTAVVFPELALVTRPGAESRRGEVEAVETALREHREVQRIQPPG